MHAKPALRQGSSQRYDDSRRALLRGHLPRDLALRIAPPDESFIRETTRKLLRNLDSVVLCEEDKRLTNALLELFHHKDIRVSNAAAREFYWQPMLAAVEVEGKLLEHLRSENQQERVCAAIALEAIGPAVVSRDAIEELVGRMEKDPYSVVRAACSSAVAGLQVSDRSVVQKLLERCHDPSPLVRVLAVEGIRKLGESVAQTEVFEHLAFLMEKDNDARVQSHAKNVSDELVNILVSSDDEAVEQLLNVAPLTSQFVAHAFS